MLVSGIGIGAMSMISAPWHALVLYGVIFALGNGAASVIPVGVMVTRAFPARTGIANAVVMSGMSVGQLVVIAVLAAVLLTVSWHSVYLWLGIAHLALVPLLMLAIPEHDRRRKRKRRGRSTASASRKPRARGQFWLLIGDLRHLRLRRFLRLHPCRRLRAGSRRRCFLAGNLLAVMGLTGLIGVVAAGAVSDRSGPIWPTALAFVARVAVFGAGAGRPVDGLGDDLRAGVRRYLSGDGAALPWFSSSRRFGTRHLGALTGLITMVHHMCGGIGAYLGAALFDVTGNYDFAFIVMLVLSLSRRC